MIVRIYFGGDHGALEDLNRIFGYFLGKGMEKGYSAVLVGPKTYDKEDDYPDYAEDVAKKVAKDPGSFGVLLCTSGQGMVMGSNAIAGARAMYFFGNMETVKDSREHNDANILCAGSKYVNYEQLKEAIITFINTKASHEARHRRRIEKVEKLKKRSWFF